MALEPRQERILFAVIKEYIRTAEPVGSSAILNRYNPGCSSATIRNDMAELEAGGYITQPHTSAGRVPLDKAYRYYVNLLLDHAILPPAEAPVIDMEYREASSRIEYVIEHTSRILSNITRYSALILAPRLRKSLFKYLKLVPITDASILMVMLTNTGSVMNKKIDLSFPLDPADLEKITNILNERLREAPVETFGCCLAGLALGEANENILSQIQDAAIHMAEIENDRVVRSGVTQLFDLPEFKDIQKLKKIMELLDQEELIAEILNKTFSAPGIRVYIGKENRLCQMEDISMITATYNLGREPVGILGVIGPTRMNYDKVISVVNYVAESLSGKLQEFSIG